MRPGGWSMWGFSASNLTWLLLLLLLLLCSCPVLVVCMTDYRLNFFTWNLLCWDYSPCLIYYFARSSEPLFSSVIFLYFYLGIVLFRVEHLLATPDPDPQQSTVKPVSNLKTCSVHHDIAKSRNSKKRIHSILGMEMEYSNKYITGKRICVRPEFLDLGDLAIYTYPWLPTSLCSEPVVAV